MCNASTRVGGPPWEVHIVGGIRNIKESGKGVYIMVNQKKQIVDPYYAHPLCFTQILAVFDLRPETWKCNVQVKN